MCFNPESMHTFRFSVSVDYFVCECVVCDLFLITIRGKTDEGIIHDQFWRPH